METPRLLPASDQSTLVSFGDEISLETHHRVVKLLRSLQEQQIDGIRNLHPAYCSLLIRYDPLRLDNDAVGQLVHASLDRLGPVALPEPRTVEIPVCYGGEFGPDLLDVANLHGLQPQDVIDLQTSVIYTVFFLGFVPGFAYLGGLPDRLATPRLQSPRKQVPRGSLGIAGNQTGVYPFSTPGGWRLLGRTPLEIFRPDRANMSLLSIGDRVRFVPVAAERFAALEQV